MSRGPGRPFRKGESGNPQGSSRRSKAKAQIKSISNEEMLEIGSRLLRGPYAALSAGVTSETTALEAWLIGLIEKGIADCDERIFSVLMSRLLGKPPETKTLQGADGGPIQVSDVRTEEEKAERAEQLRKMRLLIAGKDE